MWNKYRACRDDRLEAARLRKLMPTFQHIPELIAPVTCGCRKLVSALREDPRRVITNQMVLTGDHWPVVAEVDGQFGFEKAILWLAGGAVREFLRDASMQNDVAASGMLPVRRLKGDIFVLRLP